MYTTFCSAANSLSQLYSQTMHHQRLSFQAGERHALEKFYNWVLRQEEAGSRVSSSDMMAYMQNEIDYSSEDPPMSPRLPSQHQQSQTPIHMSSSGIPISSNSFGQAAAGQGFRSAHADQQAKNVFSNALSSPVRRSLQNYHLAQGNDYPNNIMSSANGLRNSENNPGHHQNNRDSTTPSSNDSLMDMHADSPGHESSY